MKIKFVISILLISNSLFSQLNNDTIKEIKCNNLDIIIFSKDNFSKEAIENNHQNKISFLTLLVYLRFESQDNLNEDSIIFFTPQTEDIKRAEDILSEQIKYMHKDISDTYENYVKQYVGYFNKEGDKILFINALYKDDIDLKRIREKLIFVDDGWFFYWKVRFNITKNILFGLHVNNE